MHASVGCAKGKVRDGRQEASLDEIGLSYLHCVADGCEVGIQHFASSKYKHAARTMQWMNRLPIAVSLLERRASSNSTAFADTL